jgi:hypothetical protein
MKYNKPMSQILKEMYSEDVEKAQDKLDKAKKIDALKQQIQKIKDEPTEALDDKDKETIKPIIKQLKKSVTAHDKQAKQLTKDLKDETDLEEFKTMTVTLNDPKKMKDLIQAIRIFGPKLGLKTDVMNPKKLKVYGNNTDLNKYARDIKNFYGAQIKAESVEEAVDSDDTGGAAEVDMIMNQVNQMRHFLDGIEKMVQDDGDVEEWVQGKITKATDYLKTAYSYKTGEKNESVEEKFKPTAGELYVITAGPGDNAQKVIGTNKDLKKAQKMRDDYNKKNKPSKQSHKARVYAQTRASQSASKFKIGDKIMYSTYGNKAQFTKVKENFFKEEVEYIEEFTDKQIERLRKEYEDLRGKETGINPEKFKKLRGMMKRFPKENLLKLVKADIPILTTGAKAALVMYHGMKWKQLPEDFLPYIDLFADDNQEISEAKKGKFKEVDPKVVDRIEKMMNGTRQEKDSIANMLNYLMPPEVVDMVRYKLKIVPKRGKIKFR